MFVATPEAGVPRAGVVNVGDDALTILPVPVVALPRVVTSTPSTEITPAETRAMVVSVACPRLIEPMPNAVVVSETNPVNGNPVQLVKVPADGVPKFGVVKAGLSKKAKVFLTAPVVIVP